MNSKSYQAVIFDCDGVLLDSNKTKTKAFESVLASYPATVHEAFLSYHKQHGGVSRYKKLEILHREMLKTEETLLDAAIQADLMRFAVTVESLIEAAEITPGTEELLEQLENKLFVSSGGDEQELKKTLGQKSLANYFEAILGSPKTKYEHIDWIQGQYQYSKMLFIGDSMTDYLVSEKKGLDFVFMWQFTEFTDWKNYFSEKNEVTIIKNLSELLV